MNFSLRDVHKSFGGVRALRGVSFSLRAGEVHALVGENGAGKSTLIKIMAGVHRPDEGEMLLNGERVTFRHPEDATAHGVAVIYQELAQFPDLSVLENLFMGAQTTRGPLGLIDWRTLRKRAEEAFNRLGVTIDLDTPVSHLSTAQGQLVEIARALTRDARVLIMDEPTASLGERDAARLHEAVRKLRGEGVGVVYISHRLDEIFEVADRVTVLRDGESVGGGAVEDLSVERLVALMVGREVGELYPEMVFRPGEVMLEVRHLSRPGLHDISFEVRAGEIVGLAGLVGSGRSEVARCLFGIDAHEGEVLLCGERVPRNPWGAIGAGMAYVSEDRKLEGLVLPMTIEENISLPILERLRWLGLLDARRAKGVAERFFDALGVRAPGVGTVVATLSGGNQQKVSLAKALATKPKLLILDEPTRGIDVGAKAEIHKLMARLCEEGLAILMISSELPEILAMSHRVLVMNGGRLAGRLGREESTAPRVMQLAAGAA